MTIYSYTIGASDGTVNLGADSYTSDANQDYAPFSAKFNIDSAWFKANGDVNTAVATSTNIYAAQNPTGTLNDAFVQIESYNANGTSKDTSAHYYGMGTNTAPTGYGSFNFTSGEITLTGNRTDGYDLKFLDTGTGHSAFNVHFNGTPTGAGVDYGFGGGLTIDNSKSYIDESNQTLHYFEKDDTIVCFAKGTLISTAKGLVAVEKLKAGDQVLTIDGEHAPIVWLGHRRVNCLKHSQPELANPVRVSKDAFGPGMPSADVFLSPAHAVYAYGHLVPVRHLINDVTITQESVDSITYYHIELPKHTVIFAQGLPAETYLDSDNRQFFISADQVATNVEKLDTVEFSENYGRDLYLANCYAPFVTGGPVLEAIQEKLLAMPAAERLADMAMAA